MNYQVLALDLDGTLLTPEKKILPASIAALKNAREAGAKVVIVTGRHYVAIHPFYQALGLDTPAICCNGALLYDYQGNRVLASDPLQSEQANQLIDLLDSYNVHALMYADDAMIYQEATGHIIRTENWGRSLPESQCPVFRKVSSLRKAAHEVDSIWKFALTDTDIVKLQSFTEIVERELGITCEWSWHDQVDVAQTGNSKGKRLAQWVESQGLSMSQVIAFGDNYNDLSMLESAGLGVAMGNAADKIKESADLVIGNNTESGIADVVNKYFERVSLTEIRYRSRQENH
ncbi:MAG: pyridoxal phosphatase [Pseudescherichia vulneris]|nr:pyridoxal phosphatase [Pseudescherichia vulneris]